MSCSVVGLFNIFSFEILIQIHLAPQGLQPGLDAPATRTADVLSENGRGQGRRQRGTSADEKTRRSTEQIQK